MKPRQKIFVGALIPFVLVILVLTFLLPDRKPMESFKGSWVLDVEQTRKAMAVLESRGNNSIAESLLLDWKGEIFKSKMSVGLQLDDHELRILSPKRKWFEGTLIESVYKRPFLKIEIRGSAYLISGKHGMIRESLWMSLRGDEMLLSGSKNLEEGMWFKRKANL